MEFIFPKMKPIDRLSLAYQEEVLSQAPTLEELRSELSSVVSHHTIEADSKPIVRISIPSNGREAS
jgi:hypothetical protein